MSKLYYIENYGCDDVTCGLALIPDEYFSKFKEFIENLNKNSTYGCQPTIYVYDITLDNLREATEEDSDVSRLYLGGDVFVLKDWRYSDKHEPIIGRY